MYGDMDVVVEKLRALGSKMLMPPAPDTRARQPTLQEAMQDAARSGYVSGVAGQAKLRAIEISSECFPEGFGRRTAGRCGASDGAVNPAAHTVRVKPRV